MTVDRYTKAVLTVIAVALSALAIQGAVPAANAQSAARPCGDSESNACYVRGIKYGDGIPVEIKAQKYADPLPVTVTAKEPLPVRIRE